MGFKSIFISPIVMAASVLVSCSWPAFGQAPASGGASSSSKGISAFMSDTGKIVPDVENNAIMVMDYPHNIAAVEDYLKMADKPGQQILIEARIVEVKLDKEHTFGVNWQALTNKRHLYSLNSSGQQVQGITQGLPQFATSTDQVLPVHWEPIQGDALLPFTMGFFDSNINAVISTLAAQMKTDILSAPKVTTTNNRRAKINVIKNTPYVDSVVLTWQTIAGAGGVSTTVPVYTYTYNYADEGVNMEVTPLINNDGTVTLTLYPEVKEIVKWHDMPGPSGASRNPQLPETDVRSTQTKVTVKEGQTLVIGGLMREKNMDGESKVPVLGDMPILGGLFRSKYSTKEKTELLIFVMPKIISSASLVKEIVEAKLPDAKPASSDMHEVMGMLDSLEKKMQNVSRERQLLEKEVAASAN
jgi:type II secretory pathway component GspD/PulD (secretin)